jgi:gas vesicle protein
VWHKIFWKKPKERRKVSERNSGGLGSLLAGLLVGAAAGAAAMMFTTDRQRKQLKVKLAKAVKEGAKKVDDAKVVDAAAEKVNEIIKRVKEATKE